MRYRLAFLLAAMPFYAAADPMNCDLSRYSPQPGLEAKMVAGRLEVEWRGTGANDLRGIFVIDAGTPRIREIAVREASQWKVLGRNLTPEYSTVSGVRRAGHGLPEENRWDVYWDAPLVVPGAGDNPNLPRKAEEIRRASATFKSGKCEVATDGARLEITFPGLSMGIFSGKLRFTMYRGSSLLRQDALVTTNEPSAAFKYTGGLRGFAAPALERVRWMDTGGNPQSYEFGGEKNDQPVPLLARNRVAVAEGTGGSVGVFPPPHQFFFARQLEVNLGFVWYRKDGDGTFAMGVRHGDNHGGYNPIWVERVFALYNAPPGTEQRLPVYFFFSGAPAAQAREEVMAYTHNDRYKPMPGYQTMVTHFHTALTKEVMDAGSVDHQAPWIPAIRNLGVNLAFICDFHGDEHPEDPGPVRVAELRKYFEASRRHSDKDFLIVPGEEPNAWLGGHYNVMFPKPVLWTHVREKDTPFVEEIAGGGKVYHTGSPADVFEMLKREGAIVWQTHPRTKGSTFYPDKIRETDYFRSDRWLGGAFKALPVDLSERRLCEKRCFSALDDMNNWGAPKYILGEVDTYKKFPEYDLYGDFNVNYVKLPALPKWGEFQPLVDAVRKGDFFVSTGEILIRDFRVNGAESVSAEIEWTFPLEFVEVVYGDGNRTDRQVVRATRELPFGTKRFEIPVNLKGQKWVRFAAWDSAVNGAFTQPLHLKP